MRRKDREMPESFALSVMDKCEWAALSMISPEGEPYCVPVTIAREGAWVYFHTAPAGQKIDCLRRNPRVCLVCVGDTHRIPEKFTTEYECAIARGEAQEVTQASEKTHALRCICERHAASNLAQFQQAVDRSLSVTGIWKIRLLSVTGKRKKYGTVK